MAVLKAILAKLDEVEEKYRDLYVEKDGKWVVQVDGVKTQADVDAVTRSLTFERAEHKKTKDTAKIDKDALTAWTDAAGDKKPEDIKSNLEKLSTLEAAGAPDITKNFQGLVQTEVAKIVDGRVKSETTKIVRELDAAKSRITELTGTVGTYVQKDERRTVSDAVRSAAVGAKCIPEAIGDILAVAGGDLKIVDGKVQTEDGRDAAQWLEDRKKSSPYYWPVAKGAGGNGGDGQGGVESKDNPFANENWSLSKISALVQSNPTQAAKFAEQAGVPKDAAGTSFQWHVRPAVKK